MGIATVDVLHYVDSPPRWGGKAVSVDTQMYAGGPATNAAVVCARLRGSATLIAPVGPGAAGDVVRADLAAHGVRLVDLWAGLDSGGAADAGWRLPVASCLIGPDGERTVISPGARTSTAVLTDEARRVLSGAAALLVDGHHPLAGRAALTAVPAGCTRFLDAGSLKPDVEGWLPDIEVAAASQDYAAAVAAASGSGGVQEDAALRALDHLRRAGAGIAVVTSGAEPVRWADAGGIGRASVRAVHAVDTLGAGDAFHGALVAAWLERPEELAYAIRYAMDVATTRVTQRGNRAWLAALEPLG